MRKSLLLSASIFSFFTLQSCYSSPPTEQTAQDITYVMEGQVHYPNARYLPLLDALERYEDFKRESLGESEIPIEYSSEGVPAIVIYSECTDPEQYAECTKMLLKNLRKHVMALLNGEETLNEYLRYIFLQRQTLLLETAHEAARLLLASVPALVRIPCPLSDKLFNFLVEDPLFEKQKVSLNETRISNNNSDLLLESLLQIPAELGVNDELDNIFKPSLLPENKFANASAMGGPYALLEDIIFADDLVGEKKEACLALRKLLEFDKLKRLHPSNFSFMKALFRNIYNHTNPAISLRILQIIEGYHLALFYGKNEPKGLVFYPDTSKNDQKIVDHKSIKPTIEKLSPKQVNPSWTSDDWLKYIREEPSKQNKERETYSSSRHRGGKNKRGGGLYNNRGKNPNRLPAEKSIKGSKLSKIDPKEEKKESSDFPKQAKKEKITTKQPKKSIANNPLDQAALSDEKNKSTISFTTSEGEKNAVPQTPVDTADRLNVAIIDDETEVTLIPSDQTIVVNTNPIEKKTEEITPLASSGTIDLRVDNRDASQIISFKENELLLRKAPEEHVDTHFFPRGSKQKKKKKSIPLTIVASTAEPTPTQKREADSTVGIDLNKRFVMPRGLRTFHTTMIQKAYSPIADPKHQDIIDQLFDLRQQCNTTYHQFKVLWTANGGFIIDNRGSHRTLQFPININLFGIYKPHGSSAGYGKNTVGYLQAAVLYIGLRPTDW